VDGQLARYAQRFSTIGAWLDTACDRSKEYLVYAGLAIGSTRGFDEDVWLLAACALALQTVRHLSDFAWVAVRPPGAAEGYGASSWIRRANQLVRLPIAERLALISVTAAVASPRVTFIVLLAWGGVGALFALAVRIGISYSVRPVGAR
jgi:phosphatidylglycerophosphate synthase